MVETNNSGSNAGIVFIVIVVIIVAAVIFLLASSELRKETIVVEGVIVDIELYTPNLISFTDKTYLNVTFEDGEMYSIYLSDDYYDFAVNSKIILKLQGYRDTNRWSIVKFIKVPGE